MAGQPTLYSENILVLAGEYIANAHDYYDEKSHEWIVNLPTIEGLAIHLSVHRDTLYAWAKEHTEFSDILERLRQFQANRLINKGLSGKYNHTIAKMMLTKHGYTDKSEVDLTSKGEKVGLSDEDRARLSALFPTPKVEVEENTKTGEVKANGVTVVPPVPVVLPKANEQIPTPKAEAKA